jgi:hypothetical protein
VGTQPQFLVDLSRRRRSVLPSLEVRASGSIDHFCLDFRAVSPTIADKRLSIAGLGTSGVKRRIGVLPVGGAQSEPA